MKRGTTRWAHRVLALCAASCVATVLVGCDDYGEKKALNDQAVGGAMRAAGRNDDALERLNAAAGAGATTPAVIQAQQALGQVKLAKANASATELARLESKASATLARIGTLARQARADVSMANNYRKLDPKLTVEQVGDFAAKARGDGNVTQYPVESATLPTLAVAQQNKSKIDGDVAKAQEAIATATTQRDQALAEAGKLSAAAEAQAGQDRAASVKQIADLRTNAAQASRTLAEQTGLLARYQNEQAEQAQLVTQLQTAVETLSAQGTSLTQGWQSLSTKATDQLALAKKIVDGTEADTVRSLTKTLNDQLKDINDKRGEVEALYKDAISDLGKAADKAGKRVQELASAKTAAKGAAYETAAWDAEAALLSVDRINIDKAEAQKALADLYASHAKWLAAAASITEDVESVSESLNVGAAEPFNGDKLHNDLGKAVADAGTGYEDVLATLDGAQLTGESLAGLKPMSVMLRVISLAEYADLADLAVANKVAPEVAKHGGEKSDLRENIKAAVNDARTANVPLPTLPMSLGGQQAPTTAPASDTPATQAAPAEDAATAEIRAASLKFMKAVEAGNVDEAKQAAVVAEGADAEIQTAIDTVAKIVRFRTALAAKFADNPMAKVVASQLNTDAIVSHETYVVEGDTAFSGVRTPGEPEDFRKVDGAWKAVVSLPATDAGKAKHAQVIKLGDEMGKMADEMDAGTLTDFAQVMQRVQAVMAGGAAPAEGAAATPAPATAPAP